MTESDFWDHLEFRVSREIAALDDRELKHRCCDGFDPESLDYDLDSPTPRITGLAWMLQGHAPTRDEQWPFTLFLPRPYGSRDAIEWDKLLPPENVTCWLGIDAQQMKLEIDLASAVPDDQYVPPIKLTLFTRPGCHLCERLEMILTATLRSPRIVLRLHDITDDDTANDLYWSRIPVLTHNNTVILEGRPSEAEIAAAMSELLR